MISSFIPHTSYLIPHNFLKMQLGIYSKTFERPTLGEALDAVKAHGLDCVQFNLLSAGVPTLPDANALSASVVEAIRHETTAHGIRIAAMSGTFNMAHPNRNERQSGLAQLSVLAEAAASLNVPAISLCTGTRELSSMWQHHPDNATPEAWRDLVDCMRQAVQIAEANKVNLAMEPEVNNVVDSAQKARRLMDEIGSPHLKVIMDGANVFHKGELPRMREILQESIELLAKDIVLAHAKDLDHDGDAGHLAAGHGLLDYDWYLAQLRRAGYDGAIVMHGLTEAQVPGCVDFMRRKLAQK